MVRLIRSGKDRSSGFGCMLSGTLLIAGFAACICAVLFHH
jgi:hypothetical protein